MKVWTIIFLVIFVVSMVLFFVTLSAEGVTGDMVAEAFSSFRVDDNDPVYSERTFSGDCENLTFAVANATTTIGTSSDGEIHVSYRSNGKRTKLQTEESGKDLVVKEKVMFSPWFWFSFAETPPTLEILLPEKNFRNVSINVSSGKTTVKQLEAYKMKLSVTSGKLEGDLYADHLEVFSTSGNTNVRNLGDRVPDFLGAELTSGNVAISGFSPCEYFLKTTSGNLDVKNLSGTGKIKTTSGNIHAQFDAWEDKLAVESTSGGIEIILPENSGAQLDAKVTSGNVKYNLAGKTGKASSGEYTIGGDNVQQIDIKMTSGNLSIRDS